MDERILQQKQYDRTLEWNNAGYDGEGINIWNMEGESNHGQMSRSRILDAAPKANVFNRIHSMQCSKNAIISEWVNEGPMKVSADFFIGQHNISILSQSKSGVSDSNNGRVELYGALQRKYNLTMFNSAGNDGPEGLKGGGLPESLAIYVGACQFTYKNNEPQGISICSYSSLGDEFEEVDFSTFVGKAGWSGTSFSCPYLAGIAALLQQRYGTDLTSGEIYQYFKMISQPIDTGHKLDEGYDAWSGYGIPILPPVDKKLIRMSIGNKECQIDNDIFTMDVAPFIRLQRTYVPVAFVALALGAQVDWDAKDKSVTIRRNDDIIKMWIGEHFYHINGEAKYMDVVPFIENSRTFIPIAWIAKGFNCKIGWIGNKKEILILEG